MKRIQINLDQMSTRHKIELGAAIVGILGTIVGIPLAIRSCSTGSPGPTQITTGDMKSTPVTVMNAPGDVFISYNIPEDSNTTKAIAALESRLTQTSADVNLTREDVNALACALRDLDQRTSVMERLPDGRTRIGNAVICGAPTLVIDEHNAAARLLVQGDPAGAFEHSRRAINAYEASHVKASLRVGKLKDSSAASMYYVGALSAHRLNNHERAYEWASKADTMQSRPERVVLLAAALFNVNRPTEAMETVRRGLAAAPNDPNLVRMRDVLQKRIAPK